MDAGFGMVWKHVQARRFKMIHDSSVRIVLAFGMLACWHVGMSCSVLRMLHGKIGLQYTSLERTKVNGYWTWQAVHAAGGVHTKLPYDCHAGLHNWHIGWSAPKKARRESWKIYREV